jgi:hypothetical protein
MGKTIGRHDFDVVFGEIEKMEHKTPTHKRLKKKSKLILMERRSQKS